MIEVDQQLDLIAETVNWLSEETREAQLDYEWCLKVGWLSAAEVSQRLLTELYGRLRVVLRELDKLLEETI